MQCRWRTGVAAIVRGSSARRWRDDNQDAVFAVGEFDGQAGPMLTCGVLRRS